MNKKELNAAKAALESQYNREQRSKGCFYGLLAVLFWGGLFYFVGYCIKTM